MAKPVVQTGGGANLASGVNAPTNPAMAGVEPQQPSIGGTPRATRRPAHVKPPEHWHAGDGPPLAAAVEFQPRSEKGRPDPVRYGDWELKGIAVDF